MVYKLQRYKKIYMKLKHYLRVLFIFYTNVFCDELRNRYTNGIYIWGEN